MTTPPPLPPPPHERDDLDPDEQAGVAYMLELIKRETAGERTTIALGPYSAMTIIGLLQLATRHPDMDPKMRKLARDFINQFAPLFAGTPGAEIIRQGGHPEFDR